MKMHSVVPLWRRNARLGAIAVTLLTTMTSFALASPLVIKNDCEFVVNVPGLLGANQLKYHAPKGAIFIQNGDGKFCGPASMETPFGPSAGNNCFVVTDGQFISGDWGNKVSSSNCALGDQTSTVTAFDSTQASLYSGVGPANLRGQAFLKTVGGDVKTCAGEDVLLFPAIPYFEELIENTKNGVIARADRDALSLVRRTLCDAQGNFMFSNLPAQKWYILTKVTWGVPHIEQPGEQPGPLTALLFGVPPPPTTDEQGGELLQAVVLQAGDNQAFLTDRDQR